MGAKMLQCWACMYSIGVQSFVCDAPCPTPSDVPASPAIFYIKCQNDNFRQQLHVNTVHNQLHSDLQKDYLWSAMCQNHTNSI